MKTIKKNIMEIFIVFIAINLEIEIYWRNSSALIRQKIKSKYHRMVAKGMREALSELSRLLKEQKKSLKEKYR